MRPRMVVKAFAIISFAILFMMVPSPAMAEISAEVEAELESSGKMTVIGTSNVKGFEATLVRIAIDSNLNIPNFGLLGTGNADGEVDPIEAQNYSKKAKDSGAVKQAFDNGIVKVTENGKDIPATLGSLVITGAEGNTSSKDPINVTFEMVFDLDFDQNKETHHIGLIVSFSNVSYDLRFKVPDGWNIEEVKGLKSKKVVNTDSESYVKGKGTGDGTPVVVAVKKEGDICCLFLLIGIIVGAIVVIYLIFRWRKKKKEQATSYPQYQVITPDGQLKPGGLPGPGAPGASPERRLDTKERTFGKEYFSEKQTERKEDNEELI
jgi:hypothetical protein